MKTKICSECKIEKSVEDFHIKTTAKDGRQSKCKVCNNTLVRTWQANNPEKYETNWRRQMAQPHRNLQRRANLYGLSLEEATSLLEKADGKCEICGSSPERGLVFDHDHASGEIRGLLCGNCNTGLGLFKDNNETLANAISYLLKIK